MITESIHSGDLSASDQLPSQRWLAMALGVDLTTVTRAYAEARNRGLIASFTGRGSYVIGTGAPVEVMRIDMTMNTPPQPAGAMSERFRQTLQEVFLMRQPVDVLSRYLGNTSRRSAIQAAQGWLRSALGGLDTQHLVLSEGAQAAIFAILHAHVRPGETVLCEPLTYPGFIQAAQQLGLRLVALEVDGNGVLPDAIEREYRQSGAKLLYLNPTLHNPTARTMPEHRRHEIAGVLARLPMTLIEDDPYRYLMADAPPPIASLNGGAQTYYVASLSKCLSPAFRTAFVVPPRGQDGTVLREALHAASMGGSALLTALAEHWIRSGLARQLVQDIQQEARTRQTLARALLPEQAYGHPTGVHIWLPLLPPWNQHLFAHTLETAGVRVTCADTFSVAPRPADAVRISLGGVSSRAVLAHALKTIRDVLVAPPRRPSHAIV